MLTNRTTATLVQLFHALSPYAVRLLFIKHLDADPNPPTIDNLFYLLSSAPPDNLTGLLVEIVGSRRTIRADAPTKYVFDDRHADLLRQLRSDGFDVVEDALVRLLPTAEPIAQISDYLEETLAGSGLEADGEITRLLRESAASLSAAEPDFNNATTKARIALETIARRSAAARATAAGRPAPEDTWGHALADLRDHGGISLAEENALASIYTLISPGAHVPRGLTDQQWALLSKSFAVSGVYFLLHQHLVDAA